MVTPIRIGTRDSPLATWQASSVLHTLKANGYEGLMVYIKSEGDLNLTTPLYEMGVQGIFTRSLDDALLNNQIDIAVHSMKDVPTRLPAGLVQAAVLERAAVNDLLVYNSDLSFLENSETIADIATSSIRRRAQWLHRYPRHRMHNLRGNMQTRLKKLHDEQWNGAIFAQAGLERIAIRPANSLVLDWMLPAPAQGAIVVVARQQDVKTISACEVLNHADTAICTAIERSFLRGLMGGCSTPVAALATIKGDEIHFRGNMFSPDGTKNAEIEKSWQRSLQIDFGKEAAKEILEHGGREIDLLIRAQSPTRDLS